MISYQKLDKLVSHLLDVEGADAYVSAKYKEDPGTIKNKMPWGEVKSIEINYYAKKSKPRTLRELTGGMGEPDVTLTMDGLYDDLVYGKRVEFTLSTRAETNIDEEEKEARQNLIKEIAERISTAMEWEWLK